MLHGRIMQCTFCCLVYGDEEEEEAHRRKVSSVSRHLAVVKDSHPVMAAIQSCHCGS